MISSFLFFLIINLTFVLGESPSLFGRKAKRVDGPQCEFNSLPVPLYHTFNPQLADDFYTTSISEMESKLKMAGFEGEGVVGSIFATQETGTIPVYRLFNPNLMDHSYTPDLSEILNLEDMGYGVQETVGYFFASAVCGAEPVYRMRHELTGHHLCAMSSTDMDSATTAGYSFEGVIGYLLPSFTPI